MTGDLPPGADHSVHADDLPAVLPSQALAGQGVAGWIIRAEDLDRLPVLSALPPEDRPTSPPSDPLAAYRPADGGVWPEEHITLSWAELRRLVALHLEVCRQAMPRERPWDFMAMRATAMRDGEVPLLLSEVMDT